MDEGTTLERENEQDDIGVLRSGNVGSIIDSWTTGRHLDKLKIILLQNQRM